MSNPADSIAFRADDCRRVLCVNDDTEAHGEFIRALAIPGVGVECVRSGQEAVGVFTRDSGIDVLLVDHGLPGMSGRETVAALRGHGFLGRVLIVSAALTPADAAAYRALDVEQFLAKPIATEALRAAVNEAVRLRT